MLASPLVGASLDALVVLGGGARASERDLWWVVRESRPRPWTGSGARTGSR